MVVMCCGVQKSGTTSLRNYLTRFEEFVVYPREHNIFKIDHIFNAPDWPAAIGQRIDERYFPDPGDRVRVAFDPDYYLVNHVGERLLALYPDAKILLLLRDPVERAYSNYLMELARGRENLDFRSALAKEEGRLRTSKEYFHTYAYRERGRYGLYLPRFLAQFEPRNVHIMIFETLISQTASELRDLHRFLGLGDRPVGAFPHERARDGDQQMPDDVRAELSEFYRPDYAYVAELPRNDLPPWRNLPTNTIGKP